MFLIKFAGLSNSSLGNEAIFRGSGRRRGSPSSVMNVMILLLIAIHHSQVTMQIGL